jgi:hypothetical protein
MADLGCDDFIVKPIYIDVLLDRLCLHLNLEWIYETPPEPAPEALPLVFPPQEDLETLLKFAKGGYITDIRKVIARLKASDPRLLPFADRIESLANTFQFKRIIEFITLSMDI